MSIAFTDERLRDALWPRPFRFYPQSGSTNDLAANWARDGAPNGAVVVTDEQLSGRGRFDRAWVAPPGTGLLFSVVLRPQVPAERIGRITMLGAVSVIEAVGSLLADLLPGRLALKWPNDVLLDGRKLAGLLPEAAWQGDQLGSVILGIGLNVRVDFRGMPLEQTAISLADVVDRPIDRAVLLASILRRIDYWTPRADQVELWAAWRAHLNTLARSLTVTFADGQTISGQAVDVDTDGALQLKDAAGVVHRVLAGEVTLRTDR